MLRTEIVPRIIWEVPHVQGLPDGLAPIRLTLDGAMEPRAVGWVVCYAHLAAIHALYSEVGLQWRINRIQDLVMDLFPIARKIAGNRAVRMAVSQAYKAARDVDDPFQVFCTGKDHSWWLMALRSAVSLGVWSEMEGDPMHDQVAQIAQRIRRSLTSVFEEDMAKGIFSAAYGDGAGDLLAQVVSGCSVDRFRESLARQD